MVKRSKGMKRKRGEEGWEEPANCKRVWLAYNLDRKDHRLWIEDDTRWWCTTGWKPWSGMQLNSRRKAVTLKWKKIGAKEWRWLVILMLGILTRGDTTVAGEGQRAKRAEKQSEWRGG